MARTLFFVMLISSVVRSQSYRFQRIGLEEGLTQLSVMSIVQDREGFLWFGTWDGLNRYDGYEFVRYRHDPDDSSSLSVNSIICMTEAADGRLWIGTSNRGVNVFERRSGTVIRLPFGSFDELGPSQFARLDGDTIGLASKYGLLKYVAGSPLITPVHAGPDAHVASVLRTRSGGLLTVFSRGVRMMSVSGEEMYVPFHPDSIGVSAATRLYHAAEDRFGRFWISTDGAGLLEFDTVQMRIVRPRYETMTERSFRFVMEDSQGRFWAATESGLFLAEFDRDGPARRLLRFRRVDDGGIGIANSIVYALLEDRTGVLWFGTKIGIFALPPERKRFVPLPVPFLRPGPFSGRFPLALHVTDDSSVWVGTQKELFRFDRRMSQWRTYTTKNAGLSSEGIHWIYRDRNGRLWTGNRYGLNRYEEELDRFLPVLFSGDISERAGENKIYAITEDDHSRLWIATTRGIVRYQPETGTWDRILNDTPVESQGHRYILSLLVEDSTAWAGTNARGLVRLRTDDGSIDTVLLRPTASSPGVPVTCLHRGRDGVLWAATMGMGLVRIDETGGSFSIRRFMTKEGMVNDYAYGILEDDDGCLWISTNGGLSRFDPRTAEFRNFTSRDGLPLDEFNQNSYFQDPDGTMYFGGMGGVVRFHPGTIGRNTVPPPVAITRFAVMNRPRDSLLSATEAVLRHTENFFSFEFSALNFEVPQNNRYAYRLEGLETAWNDAGTRRFANYTDIGPGEYTFRVKASNNDGVWNEEGASFRIVIVPPFWATWWFRTFAMLLFGGTVGGFVRFRANRIYRRRLERLEQDRRIAEERQRTRDIIARDLHDDLASTVGSAGLFVETARRRLDSDPAAVREFLDKTSGILSDAEEAMSDIVWSVSPKHDTLQSLVSRLRLVTADHCRARGLRQSVEAGGDLTAAVSDDVRRGFYLIFKEALTNVVRHAHATEIRVTFSAEPDSIRLTVADDGTGIATESDGGRLGGNGMHNMRKRAEEMGAVFTVQARESGGTIISVIKQMTQTGH